MKNKLQSILARAVPSPSLIRTCALLLLLGGACWAVTEKIGRDADARMRVLTAPTTKPINMLQARR